MLITTQIRILETSLIHMKDAQEHFLTAITLLAPGLKERNITFIRAAADILDAPTGVCSNQNLIEKSQELQRKMDQITNDWKATELEFEKTMKRNIQSWNKSMRKKFEEGMKQTTS